MKYKDALFVTHQRAIHRRLTGYELFPRLLSCLYIPPSLPHRYFFFPLLLFVRYIVIPATSLFLFLTAVLCFSSFSYHYILPSFLTPWTTLVRGAPKGGGGCRASAPSNPQNPKLKRNTDFVDTMISIVLRDLPFSWNQPLKSAGVYYIRILKNKLIKLRKKRRLDTLIEVMEHVVVFVCI
jgi:hypothetical protein